MKAAKFFAFLSILASLPAFAAPTLKIVSDVDDTVKLSHTGSAESVRRGLFGKQAFAGMSELYQDLLFMNAGRAPSKETTDERLYFVSGSPSFLRHSLKQFFSINGFPAARLFLRNFFASQDIFAFKVSRIARIVNLNRGESFVMFGDDTERDPQVYREIKTMFPLETAQVYIHQIKGRGVENGQLGFYTSMDIALNEVAAGRLTEAQAVRVGTKISQVRADDSVMPAFAACPSDTNWLSSQTPAQAGAELQEAVRKVEGRVNKICARRN